MHWQPSQMVGCSFRKSNALVFPWLTQSDVVFEYSYGESEHRLENPTWGPEYHDAVVEAGLAGSLMKQMFWIFDLIKSLPVSVQAKLSPSLELVLRNQAVWNTRKPQWSFRTDLVCIACRRHYQAHQIRVQAHLKRCHSSNDIPRNLAKPIASRI